MDFFYQSPLGAIHTLNALIALIAGFWVLRNTKGTLRHKRIGYIYAISMITLNFSAIPLTNLTGEISPLHIFILFSLPYILVGLYFPIFARNKEKWVEYHFEFMCYSYVGLLCAGFAEIIIRVPLAMGVESLRGYLIGIFATALIGGSVGYVIITRYRKTRFS